MKSRQDALAKLKKCFGDLVAAQYLDHDAFAAIRLFLGSETDEVGNERRVATKPSVQVERSLTMDAWAFAMGVLDGCPARLRRSA